MSAQNDLPLYLFHQGTNYQAQDYLGGHLTSDGAVFRVWAPRAAAVSVMGDFNSWQAEEHFMQKISEQGVWQTEVKGVSSGALYKYAVKTQDGRLLIKVDPYARFGEAKGGGASKLYRNDFVWHDAAWLDYRKNCNATAAPLNIYEVHLGSWRRYADGNVFNYRKSADELIPYVKKLGYTHIELMPLTEYPFDGSWGYQSCGYFSPTSRYGQPDDLAYLVDLAHRMGVGVFLDWVPAHFAKDDYGLIEFDGAPLYESQGEGRQEHPVWGTRKFDFGRTEVQSFLISSALYWLREYHIDGLRVDAVAAMLYLDYDMPPGKWTPNSYGGKENLEAIAFLRKLNQQVKRFYPDALMMAEESTAWDLVTKPVEQGGLGFDFKWNMGWMNDILAYSKLDPIFRQYEQQKLTFSLMYAFNERFILPISHDESVHGKRSLLDKFPGNYEQKFAGLRAFMAYMMAHPGKKLIFMGAELGQFKEWDYQTELDWLLLDYPLHQKTQDYFAALNHFYLRQPALWRKDDSWDGFSWLFADDKERNVVSFCRRDGQGQEIIAVVNFAACPWDNYLLGVPQQGQYRILFNSDDPAFGGAGALKEQAANSRDIPMHGFSQAISLDLPPLTALYLQLNTDDVLQL